MRVLYLIRHGKPELPENKKICLGRTDVPLSSEGKKQSEAWARAFSELKRIPVISGPLSRCVETAEAAGFEEIRIEEELSEIDTGAWDGLPFEEIKEKWPGEYEARGLDPVHTAPPEGESFAQCRKRTAHALQRILRTHPAGDLILVTHRGVIQTLISTLTGQKLEKVLKNDYGYASVTAVLLKDRKAVCEPVTFSEPADSFLPDDEACIRLLEKYKTPEKVRAHGRAVAGKAEELCDSLEEKGIVLDRRQIRAAALLHDIARAHGNHALLGAKWVFEEGYPSVAAILGDHMELPKEEERISEKSVVFLADKYVRETETVTLRERYLKDRPAETLGFAREKMVQAEYIENLFQSL